LYSGDKEHEAIIPHMMKDGAWLSWEWFVE
jgi:hypothetical protein